MEETNDLPEISSGATIDDCVYKCVCTVVGVGTRERVRKERKKDGERGGGGLGAVGAAVHEGEKWRVDHTPTGLKQSNRWRNMDPRPLLVGFER